MRQTELHPRNEGSMTNINMCSYPLWGRKVNQGQVNYQGDPENLEGVGSQPQQGLRS